MGKMQPAGDDAVDQEGFERRRLVAVQLGAQCLHACSHRVMRDRVVLPRGIE